MCIYIYIYIYTYIYVVADVKEAAPLGGPAAPIATRASCPNSYARGLAL